MSDAVAPLVMTPPQAAKLLLCDVQTVLSWIKSGELAAMKINPAAQRPRYRIRHEALLDFIERREQANRPDPPRRRRPRRPANVIQFFT